MKKNVLLFVSGMITTLLLVSLPVTALAASGAITIEVRPISVLVDGEVFQPKDAKRQRVMVFTLQRHDLCPPPGAGQSLWAGSRLRRGEEHCHRQQATHADTDPCRGHRLCRL